MGDTTLADALKAQFSDAFDVLTAALGTFSADQWATGASPYTGPGRATAHALVCAEFYTCRERTVLDHFGKAVWQMADSDVPDQDCQKAYLQDTRTKTMDWIDRVAADGLAVCDDSGENGLGRIVYALRHLQHHTGEVFAYQKQMGIPVRGWE